MRADISRQIADKANGRGLGCAAGAQAHTQLRGSILYAALMKVVDHHLCALCSQCHFSIQSERD